MEHLSVVIVVIGSIVLKANSQSPTLFLNCKSLDIGKSKTSILSFEGSLDPRGTYRIRPSYRPIKWIVIMKTGILT